MPRQRSGLGRGLEALIPTEAIARLSSEGISQIPVDKIQSNPRQPRTYFDPSEIAELAASIQSMALFNPC